jgi:hypothetical protein
MNVEHRPYDKTDAVMRFLCTAVYKYPVIACQKVYPFFYAKNLTEKVHAYGA